VTWNGEHTEKAGKAPWKRIRSQRETANEKRKKSWFRFLREKAVSDALSNGQGKGKNCNGQEEVKILVWCGFLLTSIGGGARRSREEGGSEGGFMGFMTVVVVICLALLISMVFCLSPLT
jgi:hypothetical protein